jgi:hypothetical protein
MWSPRSRRLFKSIAVSSLECHEADSIKLKTLSSTPPRVDLRDQNRKPKK